MPKLEEHQFEMHPDLLMSIIKEQAGSLWKAVIEGIMNSIDAKATRIDIELDRARLLIRDNGRGFRTKDEIMHNFKVFGQPQDQEKTFGRFRMGRGQLFAYGHNVWRSGPFQMTVDVNKRGLKHTLQEDLEEYTGCEITVMLYDHMSHMALRDAVEQIQFNAKYISIPTFLNGEQFNLIPAEQTWDHEIEEADIKIRGSGDLVIYNQGIRVLSLSRSRLNTSGVVVSKKDLKVNFARNDLMSDCPVWKEVQRVIDNRRELRAERAERGTSQTKATIDQLAKDIKDQKLRAGQAMSAKVLTTHDGKHQTPRTVINGYRGFMTIIPQNASHATSKQLQNLHSHRLAFVLKRSTLERFSVKSLKDLIEILNRNAIGQKYPFREADVKALTASLDKQFDLIDKKEWSAEEQLILNILEKYHAWLLWSWPTRHSKVADSKDNYQPRQRLITLGYAKDRPCWTDGRSYIAINRKFLGHIKFKPESWAAYAAVIMEQYCCSRATVKRPSLTISEQLRLARWHRNMRSKYNGLGLFFDSCVRSLPPMAQRVRKRLGDSVLRVSDHIEQSRREALDIMQEDDRDNEVVGNVVAAEEAEAEDLAAVAVDEADYAESAANPDAR